MKAHIFLFIAVATVIINGSQSQYLLKKIKFLEHKLKILQNQKLKTQQPPPRRVERYLSVGGGLTLTKVTLN